MQSRFESFLESTFNIIAGFIIAVVSQRYIFPLYGVHMPLSTNIWVTFWLTIISMIRSYCFRRYFNAKTIKRYKSKLPYEENQ